MISVHDEVVDRPPPEGGRIARRGRKDETRARLRARDVSFSAADFVSNCLATGE